MAVAGLTGIQALATGDRFNLALLQNGTVAAWGNNVSGQLGNRSAIASGVATSVPGLSGVTAIAAGGSHALALLGNGTVMAWGDNADGQLGNGSNRTGATPQRVTGLTGVTAVSAGLRHSLALLTDGTVMAWGDGGNGQLGDGAFSSSNVPVRVQGLTGVTAISAGGLFSAALLADTSVRTWGSGDGGQLGNGTTSASDVPVTVSGLTGVTRISAGYGHTLALLGDGSAQAWGENAFGQLGNPGPPLSNFSDVPIPVLHLSGAVAVSAGGLYSLALLGNGTVDSWGDNALGQLGNGTTADSISPAPVSGLTGATAISAGANHGLAAVGTAGAPVFPPPLSIFRATLTPNPGATPGVIANVVFSSVSAATSNDAMAVGTSQAGFGQQGFAEHWNGSRWQAVPVPRPAGSKTQLNGVVDLTPGNAWAVGSSSNGGQRLTLIERWNGLAWTVVPSPNAQTGPTGQNRLTAVAGTAANDVWAVGDAFDPSKPASTNRLLFEHFDGNAWTIATSPTPPGANQFAAGITTIASNDAWAVGTQEGLSTLAVHWDGTGWKIVSTPNLMDGNAPVNQLTAVAGIDSGNVVASGFESNVNQKNFSKPYVLRWNGSAWSLVTVPNVGTEGSQLRGVTALSATDVWVVGLTLENDGSLLTLTARFDGSRWSIPASPDPGEIGPIVDSSLNAAASPGGGVVWAVGALETNDQCCLRTLAMVTTQG